MKRATPKDGPPMPQGHPPPQRSARIKRSLSLRPLVIPAAVAFLLVAYSTFLLFTAFSRAATADDHYRPPVTTQADTALQIATSFYGLERGTRYHATFTAYFDNGGTYTLGMEPGLAVSRTGRLTVTADVADLVYFNPGDPVEWVRVCLRPPRSPSNTEIEGPDGLPLCDNVETGDYTAEGY